MANGRRWTKEDGADALRSSIEDGESYASIANRLGRTTVAVQHYLDGKRNAETPITATPHKKRPCLRCHLDFMSEGIGNRLCDSCKENDNYMPHGQILHASTGRTHRYPALPVAVFVPLNPVEWPQP